MSQSIRRALYRAKGLPDPGPTPTSMLTEFTIVVEREVGRMIDELHEQVQKHFGSRNDFLVELLKEGLRGAADAAAEVAQAKAEIAKLDHSPRLPSIEITNPAIEAKERDAISSTLRMLRGEDLAPGAAYRERP